MKKLLAVLLLLVVYPAYSQDYTYSQVEVKPPLQNVYEGGTNLNLADDGMELDVYLGFDFEFYGNKFKTVNISNNGFITFTGLNSACCQGEALPWPGMEFSIMALWTDLISVNSMNPYYKTYGEEGSRQFTVGWYNTLEFYNPSWTNTFEITLYEGSNNILFNYENLNVYAHTLTAGIQGLNGEFEQIYYGNSTQALANSAYLFEYTPPTPPEPETPIAPDCTVNPASTNCIINSTPTQTYVADVVDNNEPITETVTEEQVLGGAPPDLESLLASEQKEEMVEEEKEEELKDEISTEVLQQALAVTDTAQETDRERNTARGFIEDKETTTTETLVVDNNTETVIETVETKETIEDTVESETLVVETVESESNIESIEETETVELPVFVQNQSESTIENISIENVVDESVSEESFVANQVEQSIAIDNEITNEILTTVSQATTDEEIVESILANVPEQQKTFTEDQTDEQLTMEYVQPGVFANITPFNVEPNMADKETSGVLGKIEEKSDAEKRADEIVAANKEQQEEINKNYMEADQSGIVAAMGADTDVNSYRSRMLNDNNIWYKPEDIYKNVVYKDNVRGSYFLEKGNTDTYKKMVDEQYK